MSEPVKIGLLGRGTVGGAFAELLDDRAGAVESATGKNLELSGVLTTSQGNFDEILAGADIIVELMGGTYTANDPRDPTGDGKITINDVRACTLKCTKTNCAP